MKAIQCVVALGLFSATFSSLGFGATPVIRDLEITNVEYHGNGCPAKSVEIQPTYGDVGDQQGDTLTVMYSDMTVMPDYINGHVKSNVSERQSCATRFTVIYPEGYRMVIKRASREDDILFDVHGKIRVDSSYRFFGGAAVEFSREYNGALQERHQQEAPLDSFVSVASDCGGKADIELANTMALVDYEAKPEPKKNSKQGPKKQDDDKDKDDISMAFVDEDKVEIIWEKCK